MSATNWLFDKKLYDFLLKETLQEHPVLTKLREATAKESMSVMQIAPEQGQFMQLLIQLTGAKKTIELGTYTGYSALAVALALPEDGKLIACDVSEEWTNVAKPFWQEAGIAHKIDLRIAPANETLANLIDDNQAGTFDFAFIDADKSNYPNYYELCLQLVKPGGLIAIDNILWNGQIIDGNDTSSRTTTMRQMIKTVANDERVTSSLLTIADGIYLVRKK